MSAAFAQVVGHSPVRIWGLDSRVRLARQLERAGVAGPEAERVVVLRADWVYDEAIVRGLVAATQDCALFGEGRECVALNVASAFPDVTIVLMTGFADQRERAHGLEALIYDVIPKPFTLQALMEKVADALEGKPVEVVSLAKQAMSER